jgi:hypothetical protein
MTKSSSKKSISLDRLVLSDRSLKSIPFKMLSDLQNLHVLFLNRNEISSFDRMGLIQLIPEPLSFPNTLRILRLDCNRLIEIPPEIGLMKELEILLLQDNQLTSLPSTLGMLTKLAHFDVSGNLLTDLPVELSSCCSLTYFRADNNPLPQPLLDVCKEGPPAVMRYLEAASRASRSGRVLSNAPPAAPSLPLAAVEVGSLMTATGEDV